MLHGNSPSKKRVGFLLATSRINARGGRAIVQTWTSCGSNTRNEYYITTKLELQGFFAKF